MKALITAGLVFLASLCLAQDYKLKGVYRNTPWAVVVPTGPLAPGTPDTIGSVYQLVAIPVLSNDVSVWKLSVDGGHGALLDPQLRAACFLVELPIGSVLGGPEWQNMLATAEGIELTHLYRLPSGSLAYGETLPHPYPIEPGRQLYLVSQYANRNAVGTEPLGPLTCVATVRYRVVAGTSRGRR